MNGAHLSSFFMMNFARGSASKMIRMSRNDWCLAATSTSPVGTSPAHLDPEPADHPQEKKTTRQ